MEQVANLNVTNIIVQLAGVIAPGWQMAQPFLVTLEQDEDGSYLISDEEFAVYGDGDTPFEALQDYIISLIDYYELLAVRAKGDPAAEAQFNHLQTYLQPALDSELAHAA